MRTRHVLSLIVLLLGATACHPHSNQEAERAALTRIDIEWAAVAAEGDDVERIVGYWSDDARVYPPGMPVVDGKAALREFVAASLNIPGFSVTWNPVNAVVSSDGRLGYTTGINHFTMPDPAGNMVTTPGRYVTVWRKDDSNTWKCVLDIWNTDDSP